MKKFSIITVVYNDLAGIKKTQKSIAVQTLHDFEWIIIDGDSSDGTKEYIRNIEDKNVDVISERDHGIYHAMNKGISYSKGEFVVFLNAGDYFESENTLEIVAAKLNQYTGIDVLFCGAYLNFKNGKKRYRQTRRIEKYIWHGLPANHQATFFRRSLLNEKSYSDKYRLSGDYYIIADLYKRGIECQYLEEPVVNFSIGGFSYKNPLLAIKEAYRIQRDVLRKNILLRIASAARRAAVNLAVYILHNS